MLNLISVLQESTRFLRGFHDDHGRLRALHPSPEEEICRKNLELLENYNAISALRLIIMDVNSRSYQNRVDILNKTSVEKIYMAIIIKLW